MIKTRDDYVRELNYFTDEKASDGSTVIAVDRCMRAQDNPESEGEDGGYDGRGDTFRRDKRNKVA